MSETTAVHVRRATPADVRAAAAVKAASWADAYSPLIDERTLEPFTSPDRWAEGLRHATADPDRFFFVATQQHTLIGIAHGTVRPVGYLESLHVLPTNRGRNVGAALLDAVFRAMAREGVASMTLDVVLGNARAIQFYERRGAVRTDQHPADWAPAVIEQGMVFHLSPLDELV